MQTLKAVWKWLVAAAALVGTVLWILFHKEKHDSEVADLMVKQAEELAKRERKEAHQRNLDAKSRANAKAKNAVQDAMATGDFASHVNADIGKR